MLTSLCLLKKIRHRIMQREPTPEQRQLDDNFSASDRTLLIFCYFTVSQTPKLTPSRFALQGTRVQLFSSAALDLPCAPDPACRRRHNQPLQLIGGIPPSSHFLLTQYRLKKWLQYDTITERVLLDVHFYTSCEK